MTLQLAPIQTYQGPELDIMGNMGKGAQAGMLMRKNQKGQQAMEQMPGLLQAYKSGNKGALLQIADLDPEMAQSIMQMEEMKSTQSMRGVQMQGMRMDQQKTGLEIGEAQRSEKVERLKFSVKGLMGLQKALDGVQDSGDKNKILKAYRQGFERDYTNIYGKPQGEEPIIPELLAGEWTPEMEQDIDNMSVLGQARLSQFETKNPTADIQNFEYGQNNPEFAAVQKQKSARDITGTESIINQLRQEDPSLSYSDATAMAQGLLRKGMRSEGGQVSNLPGVVPAMAEQAGETKRAEKKAELEEVAVGDLVKKTKNAKQANDILAKALVLLPQATGSWVGTGRDIGKAVVGTSDKKTQTNRDLELLSGWLVSNVPRMEGPQSDFDVANYKNMAADIGNSAKPVEDRMSAAKTLMELNAKYGNTPGADPKAGDIEDNHVFIGGDPSQKENWKELK